MEKSARDLMKKASGSNSLITRTDNGQAFNQAPKVPKMGIMEKRKPSHASS
jgi:hypothetical protein